MSATLHNHFTVTEKWLREPSLADLESVDGRQVERREAIGDWYGCKLSSVFQPLVDSASGALCGHEAFLRCRGRGRNELSPWNLFSTNASDERLVEFDRLVRTIHVLNFRAALSAERPLFLNVHGRLLAAVESQHGAFFRRTLTALDIDPAKIVIETPVEASYQTRMLSFVLANYRQHGFRVAINVDSAAQWQLIAPEIKPDFVKIDSRLILDSGNTEGLDWVHDRMGKATLVLTRNEQPLNSAQARPGVIVQGYAYGHPVISPVAAV